MKKLILSLAFFLFAFSCILAQTAKYYEYADHVFIASPYYDMVPIGPQSAYVIQYADIVKLEGKTKTSIYDNNWSCSDFNIFTNAEDTIIYMYNYFDYDIGIDVVLSLIHI